MSTIIRWNPIREMMTMQSALDKMFDDTFRGARQDLDSLLALDVHETENAYAVTASVAGIQKDQLSISLHDGVLTISGEIAQKTTENARALLLERTYGKFTRSIRLPQPINADGVEAVIDNGVLTLTLPKSPDAQPKLIPVKTTVQA